MLSRHASRPRQTLIAAFVAWKGLLLAIALASAVAPSYDTSTTLLLRRNESDLSLVTRLTRWDAIYFTQSARRGYLFEQEWAFNAVLPLFVSRLAKGARLLGVEDDGHGGVEAALGIAVAHVAHLFAVLMLHELTLRLFDRKPLAFLSAFLHIISPAGLFLSVPYAESPFAFFAFTGYYVLASGEPRGSLRWTAAQISAGAIFGLGTALRSNGLLNGIPFAAECLAIVHALLSSPITGASLRNAVAALFGPVIGGVLVATGSVVPQYRAWLRYCSGASEARAWCGRTVPGIYAFVQDHYWYVTRPAALRNPSRRRVLRRYLRRFWCGLSCKNMFGSQRTKKIFLLITETRGVGFLRYWTPSNIPLFALAAPMLALLMVSGLEVLKRPSGWGRSPMADKGVKGTSRMVSSREIIILSLAGSQVLLAVLAIMAYHVQIITRIASGYAVWYWWAAGCLLDNEKRALGSKVVTYSVMYALIQGALFASFLPPA